MTLFFVIAADRNRYRFFYYCGERVQPLTFCHVL